MSYETYIAFGSNLGNRVSYINQALDLLIQDGIIFDALTSSYYRTEPMDAGGQFYINTVIRAQTNLSADDLLHAILQIEEQCGRTRYGYHNPRTIDIDILLYEDILQASDTLTLPHPRMQERAFVISPLLEINPNIIIPGIGNIGDIIVPPHQSIEKLHSRNFGWKGKRAIMGILNITPDSFFDGGKYNDTEMALQQVEKMISEGVDIIDIGGQSTRPGHETILPEEEIRRIEPIVSTIRKKYPDFPISIDSSSPEVIQYISKYRIDIINNVSGGDLEEDMMQAIVHSGSSYILTSSDADFESMGAYFMRNIEALYTHHITDIIIDPGFGFGKELHQNYQILAKMGSLQKLNVPILIGISRKSMIYKSLDIKPAEALNGTTAIHMLALMNGAHILRVHDIKEAKEAIHLFEIYERNIT